MERLKMTCHACRNACEIEAEYEDGEVTEVIGNGCMRGIMRAQNEVRKLAEQALDMGKKTAGSDKK